MWIYLLRHEKIIVVTVIVGLLLGFFYLFWSTKDLVYEEDHTRQDKLYDITNAQLIGYEEGKKKFSISAENVYARHDLNRPQFVTINAGVFYDKKKTFSLQGLRARKGAYDSYNKNVDLSGAVSGTLIYTKDTDQKRMRFTSGSLHHEDRAQLSELAGSVTLHDKKNKLTAGKMTVFHASEKAHFIPPITVHGDKHTLSALSMVYDFNSNVLKAQDDVIFSHTDVHTKEKAKLKTTRLTVTDFDKDGRSIDFPEPVHIYQKNKYATAKYATYDEETEVLALHDKAHITFKRLGPLLSDGEEEVDESEMGFSLNRKTDLDADFIKINNKNGNFYATGNVVVKQLFHEGTSQEAIYFKEEEKLVFIGDVHFKKVGGQEIQADTITFFLDTKTYEAEGMVETDVIINR
ncbi:LPS export ABC transporter periplasmic protein LptC [Candidatus Margulisiibacteriota bacterium]